MTKGQSSNPTQSNKSNSTKFFSNLRNCLDDVQSSWHKEGSLRALLQDWSHIAGDQLAPNCFPISFINGVVVIGASQPQWRQAILYNRPQLLAAIKAAGYKVKTIKIQQYHLKKAIQQENELIIWEKHPSRNDIHGTTQCLQCKKPCPSGEIDLWGKCSFCKRKELKN